MYIIKCSIGEMESYVFADGVIARSPRDPVACESDGYKTIQDAEDGIKWLKKHDWLNLGEAKNIAKYEVLSV